MSIQVQGVSKTFGSFQAVEDVDLNVEKGELVALLGPSGSGKTTLLRLIAGLEGVDQGRILFNKTDFTNKSVADRKVGFVFQHYALFKHMSIFDNIAFGLTVRSRKERPSKSKIKEIVYDLLKLVQLEGLGDRYPSQLSGGQRQRVALARALAVEPEVLLLDEPFGALDAKVRLDLRRWLRELQDKLNITTIFVTHDQEEALEMADTIVVMNKGKIEQIGTPEEVYHQPANSFVYNFLGRVNEISLSNEKSQHRAGFIRPHEIDVSLQYSSKTSIPAIINHVHLIGPTVRLDLQKRETGEYFEVELGVELFFDLSVSKGDSVFVGFEKIQFFHEDAQLQSTKLRTAPRTMHSVGVDV